MLRIQKKGFTLIELIIVIAIIALLAAALFVAIDPAKRISLAKDSRRWADVTSILNAILTYTADAQALPSSISAMEYGARQLGHGPALYAEAGWVTCTASTTAANYAINGAGGNTLSMQIVPTYLATMPIDPDRPSANTSATGYYISRGAGDRITVGSCFKSSYTTGNIEVTR